MNAPTTHRAGPPARRTLLAVAVALAAASLAAGCARPGGPAIPAGERAPTPGSSSGAGSKVQQDGPKTEPGEGSGKVGAAVDPDRGAGEGLFGPGGLIYEVADGGLELRLTGRAEIDAATYEDEGAPFALDDGVKTRRLRASVRARFYDTLGAEFEYDFADDDQPVKDAVVRYVRPEAAVVTAGNFYEPFSFAALTSSADDTALERPLPVALTPGRNTGLAVRAYGWNGTAGVGVFGGNINREPFDSGVAVSGRVTYAPILDDRRLLHIGGSLSHRWPGGGDLFFASAPESRVTSVNLVATPPITAADAVTRFGLETAGIVGPLFAQAEYIRAHVARGGGEPDVTFAGAYVTAGWILTGESRPYDEEEAIFTSITPASAVTFGGGLGAWAVTARYSFLDLDDEAIRGGREQNYTVGLNWYLNPNFRILAEYIHAVTDGGAPDAEVDVYQTRFQVVF